MARAEKRFPVDVDPRPRHPGVAGARSERRAILEPFLFSDPGDEVEIEIAIGFGVEFHFLSSISIPISMWGRLHEHRARVAPRVLFFPKDLDTLARMRKRDTFDVLSSVVAVGSDALAVFGGFWAAEWIRFESGWIPLFHEVPLTRLYYFYGALVATLLFLFIFRALGLYIRPQLGQFSEKIPRLVRAVGLGMLLAMALAFTIRIEPPFSRLVVGLSFFTVLVFFLLERAILFKVEIELARGQHSRTRVLLIGSDHVAARLKAALEQEPRLRTRVIGFLEAARMEADPGALPASECKGTLDDLDALLKRREADEVILVEASIPHARMVDVILACDRHMVAFKLVPDLFRVLTSEVEVQTVGGVPVVGLCKWPLDFFWNRAIKRAEDVAGALVGLLISAPVVALAAVWIKATSPGPVFFKQERCGEKGRCFPLFKLRTMRADAEANSGPVWTVENDPRRTRAGAFLRRFNLDELPQFWNVLKGDMSLVGPRPERPHFVEMFKEDIGRYMWRHVSKPGLTGWAQVNGMRGNTDIRERIAYDLYYLENWSLSFDFKIIARTFFSTRNAY